MRLAFWSLPLWALIVVTVHKQIRAPNSLTVCYLPCGSGFFSSNTPFREIRQGFVFWISVLWDRPTTVLLAHLNRICWFWSQLVTAAAYYVVLNVLLDRWALHQQHWTWKDTGNLSLETSGRQSDAPVPRFQFTISIVVLAFQGKM